MTWTPLSRSKVKGQGHQAALLSAALTRKAAAAVSVGTYSAWESLSRTSRTSRTCLLTTLRLLGGARGAWAPTGGEGQEHIVWPRAQLVSSHFLPTISDASVFCFDSVSSWIAMTAIQENAENQLTFQHAGP